MAVRVATASESADCERATIERGTSSAELMRRAGEGAASVIADLYGSSASNGIAIFAGPGNNGGDGWVVADALARRGVGCSVFETGEPRSDEARVARAGALRHGSVSLTKEDTSAELIVDALLGTGSTGAPRGAIAEAIGRIAARRGEGATVVSLDLPSGLDATSGEHADSVTADMTVAFGTVKRGHLIARELCGRIVALDIGLDSNGGLSALPLLVDARWVHQRVPDIPQSAHKGTRKRLAVIGGGKGMAGAAILAGEGALRSGIGLLRVVVAPGNEVAIHAGIPPAIVERWPAGPDDALRLVQTADAMAIGPGLGSSSDTRDLVERILLAWSGPVVLDADALNVFAGDGLSLAQLLKGRPAVITPHPAELGRLVGMPVAQVLSERFDIGLEISAQIGTAVVLKGSPTVVFAPTGERFVVASGTAALATGGSGDVLTGMTGTLLAQMCGENDACSAAEAAACAAFVHGRAAEMCGAVRGVTLDDVLHTMPAAWNETPLPARPGVLAQLESRS